MITITTSNVNGIRAAKRKGIETWAGEHAPDIWCMQEVRAPQDELNPIFGEFGFEYATAGKIADQSELTAMNEVCRVKGRAGVGLLTDLPVTARRYGLSGLDEDVDSGRWIEADVTTPQGYWNHRRMRVRARGQQRRSGENGAEIPLPRHHAHAHGRAAGRGLARRQAGRAVRRLQHRAHAARHQERQGQHQACRVPARRTRLHRPLAGGVRSSWTSYARSPATSRGRTRGGVSAAGRFDNNVGWRIDYQFATPELAETARGFVIDKAPSYDARWSDHAPLTVTYDV